MPGVLKWVFISNCGVFLYKAYQGLIVQKTATGTANRVGDYLTGNEAVLMGLQHLTVSVLSAAIAWALWFFWQRNED